MSRSRGSARRERRSGPRAEIAAATGGTASAPFEVTGVDLRQPRGRARRPVRRDEGTVHDGHRFVARRFAAGAAGALVSQPVDGPHVLVADTFAALERSRPRLARALRGDGHRRHRLGRQDRTKEALFAALDRGAPGKAHRSVKSYNNHTGVPLEPGADAARGALSPCSKWA